MIGRALCRSGEIVFDLEVTGGRLTMLPASASYVTVGNGDPRTWIYTVTVDGPHKDYRPERFGLNPPQAVNELRRDVERSVLAACGVPPVLANHAAPGTSMREAWRQFHTLTVEPLAELIGDQLSEALGTSVALDMRRARAADVVMLVRAATSLVEKGGMNIDAAREVVGL